MQPSSRYFDTSFLAPLILDEDSSPLVSEHLAMTARDGCATSRWTGLEFNSLLGIRVRRGAMSSEQALLAERGFKGLMASFTLLDIGAGEIDLAAEMMREHRLGLRAGDALHLATARASAVRQFLTLDKTLLRAGRHFGVDATPAIALPGYEEWQ